MSERGHARGGVTPRVAHSGSLIEVDAVVAGAAGESGCRTVEHRVGRPHSQGACWRPAVGAGHLGVNDETVGVEMVTAGVLGR